MLDTTPHHRSPSSEPDAAEIRRRLLAQPSPPPSDPTSAAAFAGLVYASTSEPGLTRRRSGRGFSYRDEAGRRITDPATLARIQSLVIPPAWDEVWINPDPNGHIQATGVDRRGRRQYRYHGAFRAVRDEAKYHHLIEFARSLPKLRARILADMRQSLSSRRQVLATVVHLLETTMIRVGNRPYAQSNHSFGLTTLTPRHVSIDGTNLRFHFKGKSGKEWRLSIRDRRIVRIVKSCQELPGQTLFRYVDEDGEAQCVTSADVNAFLREVSGSDITAKDFRTWSGTVLAAVALAEIGPADHPASARRNLRRAIAEVAAQLRNTPAICRQCYVHPAIVDAYLEGSLDLRLPRRPGAGRASDLRPEEVAVLRLLEAREAAGRAAKSRTARPARSFCGKGNQL